MKIQFNKYPIDLILCLLSSFILIPIAIFNLNEIIRIILGLPFIFFIPGYILIFALFPTKKTDVGINFIERIALSIGFSIAIVPTIGLGLNYTTTGIQLESLFLCIFLFIIGFGVLGLYRWFNLDLSDRHIVEIDISQLKSKGKLDFFLNILLIFSLVIVIVTVTYVLVTPKQKEKITEFFLLGPGENSTIFTRSFSTAEYYSVKIGIANHEYETIDYTIEVWLVNQTEFDNKTITQNMWFLDKILIRLDHSDIDINKIKENSLEYPYSFNLNKTGSFKLMFLLFKTSTIDYSKDLDYKDIAGEKINSAYRETHLWINIVD
jgi:uncharacterized membrane protein